MKIMTMPRQRDHILPALALVVFLLGGILFKYDQRLPETVWEGRDLIAGLEPKELTKIIFKTKEKTFSISKQGDGFVVDSQNSAPADMQKINEVILRLGGAQITGVEGSKADWDKMNVSDSQYELQVELFTRGDSPKWKVYLGKVINGKSGRAARLNEQNEVFATKDFLYIPTNDTEYISKIAFDLSKVKIKSVELSNKVAKVDEKKFVKDDLISVLSPLKVLNHFKTGALPPEFVNLKWEWTAQLMSESGVLYNVSWAKVGERWLAKAQANMNQTITELGPIVDISVLTQKADVDRFNQSKMGWVWELDSESVNKLKNVLMLNTK
ncbi:MAG: hypothetical protein JNM93_08655 [Bacteriovoracaceae bacterium]|nr:hypothetical protein [Bacteriovoracaceae bacterium]